MRQVTMENGRVVDVDADEAESEDTAEADVDEEGAA